MDVLFIGGTGNISAACAAQCVADGHRVGIVTRTGAGIPAGCQGLVADRQDETAMRRVLDQFSCDVVVNFLGFKIDDVALDWQILQNRVRQYIFISSATVYAKPHRFTPISEAHPLGNPHSEYARRKQACEAWLLEKWRIEGFPVTIVRPSHTYSCRWLPNVVRSAGYTFGARLRAGKPVFVPGDGTSLWTLTASADFAGGLAGLVGNPAAPGECCHITSDEALTWMAIYRTTARALGVENPKILTIPVEEICRIHPALTAGIKGDKAENGVFDNRRIKQLVPGFACQTTFAEGIAEAVAWFDADDHRKVIDPVADGIFDKIAASVGC